MSTAGRLHRVLGRAFRRLPGDRRGAAATEFGLVIIPFSMLMMGGLELAHEAYLRSVLSGAVQDVARRAAVQSPSFTATGSTLEERVAASIRARVDPVAPGATYLVEPENFFDFSGIGKPEKLVNDRNGNGRYDSGDCFQDLNSNNSYDTDAGRAGIGGANDVVFYRVTVTMNRLFPVTGLFGWSNRFSMVTETAVRNQPYATQTVPPTVCV